MNFLLFPFPHSLSSPSCRSACALPDTIPRPAAPGGRVTLAGGQRVAPACPLSPSTAGAPLVAGTVAPQTHSPHRVLITCSFGSSQHRPRQHRASPAEGCHLPRWELHGCREVLQKQPPPLPGTAGSQQVGWCEFHRQHGEKRKTPSFC